MAYDDDVQSQVRTISTVWIAVIVVLVVLGVLGVVVAIWMWRRHVNRRKKRMDAFYATPITQGPSQQQQQQPQYPNYNYQPQTQEVPTTSPAVQPAQLDAQETGVSNHSYNTNANSNYNNNNNYNTQTRSELYA